MSIATPAVLVRTTKLGDLQRSNTWVTVRGFRYKKSHRDSGPPKGLQCWRLPGFQVGFPTFGFYFGVVWERKKWDFPVLGFPRGLSLDVSQPVCEQVLSESNPRPAMAKRTAVC